MRLIGIIFIAVLVLSSCSKKNLLTETQNIDLENYSIISAINPVSQTTQNTCGLAALVCVFNYWDILSDQGKLLELFPPNNQNQGYSLSELKEIANGKSFDAFLLKGDIPFLKEQILFGRPIIVPLWMSDSWEFKINRMKVWGGAYNHYVVAYGFSQDHIWVMDPDKGVKTIPVRKFLKMWEANKNISLLVAKTEF